MTANPQLTTDRALELAKDIIERSSDEKLIDDLMELLIGIVQTTNNADRYTAIWTAARELYNHSSACQQSFEAYLRGEHVAPVENALDTVS